LHRVWLGEEVFSVELKAFLLDRSFAFRAVLASLDKLANYMDLALFVGDELEGVRLVVEYHLLEPSLIHVDFLGKPLLDLNLQVDLLEIGNVFLNVYDFIQTLPEAKMRDILAEAAFLELGQSEDVFNVEAEQLR